MENSHLRVELERRIGGGTPSRAKWPDPQAHVVAIRDTRQARDFARSQRRKSCTVELGDPQICRVKGERERERGTRGRKGERER